MSIDLGEGDALLIIDVQRDFCRGGALEVPGGDEVVPVLNRWIAAAAERGAPVFASRDWHPPDHASFKAQGGPWPPHCVRGTPGARFHDDLRLPADTVLASVGEGREEEGYSAFESSDLEARLRERGVRRVLVGGLATDYCVRASVLAALEAGFRVGIILDGIRPVEVEPGDGERAVAEMTAAGAVPVGGAPGGGE